MCPKLGGAVRTNLRDVVQFTQGLRPSRASCTRASIRFGMLRSLEPRASLHSAWPISIAGLTPWQIVDGEELPDATASDTDGAVNCLAKPPAAAWAPRPRRCARAARRRGR